MEQWLAVEVRQWFSGRILPVTGAIAERWGQLAATAKRGGIVVAVVDGVIAATAIEHDLTVVTRNVRDFARIGVPVLNPWEE